MSAEEFRRHGRAVVDYVANYLETLEERPVVSPVAPGDVRAQLPPHPPERGEPFEAVLADVDRIVAPALTHWQHPGFFAYFPANASGPSILAELLSAGFGVQGMLWSTSPAATELEEHVLDWLAELLDLPSRFRSGGPGGGVIQDSASSATLCALLAARERATQGAVASEGVRPGLVVYATEHAHSSIEKAVRIAGLGTDALRRVPTDAGHRMDPDALEALLAEDAAASRTPCAIVASVGTTSSTAIDPVRALGGVARRYGAWLHVDAAYAGVGAVAPELRAVLNDGLELADSYCTNPHKWLLVNFDCDAFYVADRTWLLRALSVLPEYLRNAATESGAVVDYRDWQVPLGRRFRALKLWFTIRHYGAEGLRAHVRQSVGLARELAAAVDAEPDFERVGEPDLGLVCFRLRAGDDANRALLAAVNADPSVFLTSTVLDGRFTLRAAIGGVRTERRHVLGLWQRVQAAAATIAGPA